MTGLTPDAPLDCARCPPSNRARASRSFCPAYNEAERIGPALDELFGYLHRRGELARDGAPGAAMLPEAIEVLVVDDGSTDATVDDRRGSARGDRSWSGRHDPAPAARRPRRQGRGRPGRDARRDRGPDRLRRRRHGDPARPAAAARRGAGRPRRRRSARGSSRTARTCAPASPAIGGCSARHSTCSRRSGSSGRCRTRNAGSRGSPAPSAHDLFARQQITSIVFDVELIYLARRRGYRIAIVPIHWYDRRGSRMRARPALALRVAWDLFRIPLIHRPQRAGRDIHGPDGAVGHRPPGTGGAADRRRARLRDAGRATIWSARAGRHARLRLPRLSPGRRPAAQRPAAVRHELRRRPAASASSTTRRRSRRSSWPFGLLPGRRPSGPGRRSSSGLRRRDRAPAGAAARSAGGSSSSPGCRGRSPTR